jgi:hypothetical protein
VAEVEPPLADPIDTVATPVPLSCTDCGLPAALSVMERLPLRAPVAVGVNVTAMLHVSPAGSVEAHVLVSAKSPEAAMLEIAKAAVPEFFRVIDCAALATPSAWLPNSSCAGVTDMPGAGITPVPVSATACGLPLALSLIVSVPVREPAAVGVKMTEILQLDPAAALVPQVFV